MMRRRGGARRKHLGFVRDFLLILIFLFVVAYGVWYIFLSSTTCTDWECFNTNLESCTKAEFIGGNRMILEYDILGIREGKCYVEVTLLQGEFNTQDSQELEGQSMVCELTPGVLVLPEARLDDCHGRLKESWQGIIIDKLHSYLLQNVGQINLDILEVPT